MLFNFVIAGTPTERLAALDDALRPLFFGLRAAGHRVVAVGQRFEKRPVVNLVVADGPIAARARHEAGPGACLGLLCVDPVTPAVRQLAQSFDFIWGCAPTAAFTDPCAVMTMTGRSSTCLIWESRLSTSIPVSFGKSRSSRIRFGASCSI